MEFFSHLQGRLRTAKETIVTSPNGATDRSPPMIATGGAPSNETSADKNAINVNMLPQTQ